MNSIRIWRRRGEQWVRRRRLLFVSTVAAVVGLLALLAPVELRQEVLAPADDGAKTYFGEAASVGQSFVPLPGLAQLRIRVGRQDQAVKSPFILHLRQDYFGEDIRTATVFEPAPETEEVLFRFPAVRRAAGPLLWVLEAPHGPSRGYWVYREQDPAAFPEGKAAVSGKIVRGNFAFTQVGSQPELMVWRLRVFADMQTWEKQSLVIGVAAVAIWLVLLPWVRWQTIAPAWWVGGLIAGTLVLHTHFARQLPLIIDEGAYLQDAAQTTWTFWPLRDFLAKGPIYVLLLKLWYAFAPETLAAWRFFSAISWAGVVGGVALLARQFGLSPAAQVAAAALLALLPGVVSATTPLLLQMTSTLFVVFAMLAVAVGAREQRARFIVLGALLMAVGYLTRSSTIAAGVAGAVTAFVLTPGTWRPRARTVSLYAGVGLLAMAAVAGAALAVMGPQKTAVLFNVEAVVVGNLQTIQAGGVEPLLRWITQAAEILWRGGSWLLAGVVALPLLVSWRLPGWTRFLVVGLALTVFAVIIYHLSDMGYLLPGVLLPTRLTMLGIVFGLPLLSLVCLLLSPPDRRETVPWTWLAVNSVWLGMLVLLYREWGVYRAQYIVEFLPPLALLAAPTLAQGGQMLARRPVAQALVAGLAAASWWQGASLLITRPVTGTVTPEAVAALSQVIAREVPPGQEIFTAQPIVAAAAGRPIIAGYSHPGWILYSRLGQVPEVLRQLYFADADEITEWLKHEVQFVVTDSRTNEVYFAYSPERQQILNELFELITEIPNDLTEEPFRLYRRQPQR